MADIIKQVQRGVGNIFEAFREQPKQTQTRSAAPRPAAVAQSAANTVNPITAAKLRAGSPRVGEFRRSAITPCPPA